MAPQPPDPLSENKFPLRPRDGALTSIWQGVLATSGPSPVEKKALLRERWDVLIVGAGITGLTAGLRLQEAGKRCLIVEAHEVGFGTSGGTTAHINTLLDTPYHVVEKDFGAEQAKLFADAARVAGETISRNVSVYGIDCDFSHQAGYLFAQNEQEEEELQKIYDASRRAGVDVVPAERIPVSFSFRRAITFRKQAQIHPLKYLDALARAFRAAGGILLTGTRVTESGSENDTHQVETTAGMFQAEHLLYATHIPPGVNILHFRCAPYRSYVLGARLADGAYPDGLAYDMQEPYHYFRTCEIDGQPYLLVGGEDHKTGHGKPDQAFRDLEAYLRKHFEVQSVDYRWSAQFFEPADGLPYIGLLRGAADRTYVATGYSGNGMVHGSFAGVLLSDLILGKKSPFEKLFSPSRIKPIAAFANFVKENADVIYRFVADRVDTDKLVELVDLVPDTGAVVRLEDKLVAVHKSSTGKLRVLNPRCTHAGCIVAWNNAEKSWDCPCHGGRYDPAGKVLTGPPRKDLETLARDPLQNGREDP